MNSNTNTNINTNIYIHNNNKMYEFLIKIKNQLNPCLYAAIASICICLISPLRNYLTNKDTFIN